MQHQDLRDEILASYRQLIAAGLGTGASGNLSARCDGGMLITPTGIVPAAMRSEQLVQMTLQGDVGEGQLLPSSEWHMHAAIYHARPEVEAVVHCHSRYATILACVHLPIPPIHYMVAITGADSVPLADYARFGTEQLAANVLAAMGEGGACLLANHGQITAADSLGQALRVAEEVEEMAAVYWGTQAIGGGKNLSDADMSEVRLAFAGYGQQSDQ
jgi:L-fuculose-phosphate aldolase